MHFNLVVNCNNLRCTCTCICICSPEMNDELPIVCTMTVVYYSARIHSSTWTTPLCCCTVTPAELMQSPTDSLCMYVTDYSIIPY